MASVYSATTEGEVALSAATARTVIQLVGATTCKARILEFGVSFDGISGTAEPVQVRIIRQSTAGTFTAASEVSWDDPDAPAASCAAGHSFTSTEPTSAGVLAHYEVHPQTGIVIQYPLGREPVLDNATTSRIGIVCTAPATVNAVAYIVWEE